MAELVATETTYLAAGTIHFRCGRGACAVKVAIDHPGYTITFAAGDTDDAERQRAIAWAAIVEVWRHDQECRTFTQDELTRGEAGRWLDALHSEGTP